MRKLSLIISVLLFSTSLFAASTYEDAVKLFKEKQYNESIKIVANLLVVDNDLKEGSPNYNLRYLAAHLHWKLGNDKSVLAHFRRCMEIKKDTVDPYVDLALFFIEKNDYNQAQQTALVARKIQQSPMIYFVLGKVSLAYKNYTRAKLMFEKANSLNPELYVSYNGLGIALMHLGKYGEANTAFSVALAGNPDSPEILNNLGISQEKAAMNKPKDQMQQLLDKAYGYVQKAAAYDDKNKTIAGNLTRIKGKINRFK